MPERREASAARREARLSPAWNGSAHPEPSVDELEALGLGVTIRPYFDRTHVRVLRVYCLDCGIQIDALPGGAADHWLCPQGCNAPNPERRSTD